jgi:hypothetical protein
MLLVMGHCLFVDRQPSTIDHLLILGVVQVVGANASPEFIQKPSTINREPSTVNRQPSTMNHQESSMNL